MIPSVFNGIEVRRICRPIQKLISCSSSSSYIPPLLLDGLDPEEPHLHVPGGELADQHGSASEAPSAIPPPEDPAPAPAQVPHVI